MKVEVRCTEAMTNANNKTTKKHQESYSSHALQWLQCYDFGKWYSKFTLTFLLM